MGLKLEELSIGSLRRSLESGELKAVDVCRAALERIEELGELNAFISVTKDLALNRAEVIDRAAREGEPLPQLAGAPFSQPAPRA